MRCMDVTGLHIWCIYIDPAFCLVSRGTKPLPVPIFTKLYHAIWRHQEPPGGFVFPQRWLCGADVTTVFRPWRGNHPTDPFEFIGSQLPWSHRLMWHRSICYGKGRCGTDTVWFVTDHLTFSICHNPRSSLRTRPQGPLLLTCLNFNPSMDK